MPSDLQEIRARAAAATPGPWRWTIRHDGDVDLVAAVSGVPYVMGCRRYGMNVAQPAFAADRDMSRPAWHSGFITRVAELPTHEHPERWPQGAAVIDNPDAEFIAHARADVDELLELLDSIATAGRAFFDALNAGDVVDSAALQEALAPLIGERIGTVA